MRSEAASNEGFSRSPTSVYELEASFFSNESRAGDELDVGFKKGEQLLRIWAVVGIALAASSGPTLAQDAAAGEQVFKRLCSPCHEIGEGAKVKLGPPLNGIDGRKSGTFDGFNYSAANKSSGITWNEESFSKYIRAPMQEIPGTRMAFVGIKNDKDIAALWAYLKQFGADGAKK
jgi:cytochrome c